LIRSIALISLSGPIRPISPPTVHRTMRSPLLFLALAAALHAAPPAEPAPLPAPPAPATAPSSDARPQTSAPAAPAPELNIRTLGAIGDGQPHPVSEWIAAKKYKNLRDIQRDYPFVTSLDWSADEAAFQRALHDLPPAGGTIRIPAGKYIATAYGWRIYRDHVRLLGAGFRNTTLTTGPKLEEGLVLSPYRHVGWIDGADREYPFASDSGINGDDKVRLREPARVAEFQPGELVFIRNGACRFDQDYGEFNEIAGTTTDGDIVLKHPLSRDYTLPSFNWANQTAEPLALPKPGKTVAVRVRSGEGFFELPSRGVITVGEALLEIVSRKGDSITLRNPGHNNPPPGTVLPASTTIGKSRSVIKLSRSTRDFHAEGLRIYGRRKALNVSNSYGSTFLDCDFVRSPDASVKGGLTIDGDDGRFAEFTRCTVRGTEPCGMQFARSFGNITFTDCTFAATNVAFSEFCFAGTLQHSSIAASASLGQAIIVGRSCGDLRIEDNQIVVSGGPINIFDAPCDIQSHKLDAPGGLTIRNNRIVATTKPRVFLLRSDRPAEISGNTLNGRPAEPPGAKASP
jgi:hypothetical protein